MKNWPVVSLGEIFEIARGGSPRPIQDFITEDSDGVNWIMIGDASDNSKYITNTRKRILRSGVSKSRMVYPGDFLLTNSMSFGHPYIMKTTGCIHDGWLVLSNKGNAVDQDYFYYLLGSETVYSEFARRASGTTVKNLNIDLVSGVKVALPPLEEQRRIAAILDKADEVRRKRREAIRLTEELLRSHFLEMFGDFSNMPVVELESLAAKEKHALSSGPFGSNLTSAHYVDEGVLVLRGKNVAEGKLDLSDTKYITSEKAVSLARSTVSPGDVVVIAVGASGIAFPLPEGFPQAVMSQNFNKITPNREKVDPVYLAYTLNSPFVQSQLAQNITDTVRTFLSLTKLRKVLIPLPKIELQHQFSNLVKQIAVTQKTHARALSKTEALFNSLLQSAFRGDL